ncbi:MAG: hypothetical protein EPN30_08060 [Actinomycetota bacterium]|nr:MAG: hypothetical protein EPN30_08060 [Actinomycetota bacterium]
MNTASMTALALSMGFSINVRYYLAAKMRIAFKAAYSYKSHQVRFSCQNARKKPVVLSWMALGLCNMPVKLGLQLPTSPFQSLFKRQAKDGL